VQRAILVDGDKCVGCSSCAVTCKLEHNLPPYPAHPPLGDPQGPELIRVQRVGPQIRDGEIQQYFEATTCMHCLDAPCIRGCPTSAIYKDPETGITLVDEGECTGCESCLSVCPYGIPQFHDGRLYLCDLCIHRLREGRLTACEAACPARAIHLGTGDEISAQLGKRAAGGAGQAD
jgi:Fe-S-cluster-containing dehydrogenase component